MSASSSPMLRGSGHPLMAMVVFRASIPFSRLTMLAVMFCAVTAAVLGQETRQAPPAGKVAAQTGAQHNPAEALKSSEAQHAPVDNTGDFLRMAFSSDGKRIVSTHYGPLRNGSDNSVKVWDSATEKEILSIRVPDVSYAALSHDGKQIVTGSGLKYDSDIALWDAATGKQLFTFATARTWPLVFTPDGRQIIAPLYSDPPFGCTVVAFDAATGKPIRTMPLGPVGDFASSVNGRWFCNGKRLHDFSTGKASVFTTSEWDIVRAISPDGRWIITHDAFNTLKVWDVATGRVTVLVAPKKKMVMECLWPVFSLDSRRFAAHMAPPGGKGEIRVWDMATFKQTHTWPGPNETALAFSPDGQRLATADAEEKLKILDLTTPKQKGSRATRGKPAQH
ncbi:MAG: hypothetical protein K8T91_04350 [Planctomycetes bacterium]|nr:hypothetical protein [Planctomycetota bacterium]